MDILSGREEVMLWGCKNALKAWKITGRRKTIFNGLLKLWANFPNVEKLSLFCIVFTHPYINKCPLKWHKKLA
jgi:hypothetical protein